MKKGIIYEWRNKLDGKFYVGQTTHPKRRYNDHVKAKGDSLFHRAIKKHGIENFEYTVVATYKHETEQGLYDLLNEAEVERIKFRNSLAPNGYNVAEGGKNGNPRAGLTQEEREEIRKLISEKTGIAVRKKYENDPEYRKHVSESGKIAQNRPEVKEKNRQAQLKSWETPGKKQKQKQKLQKIYDEHPEIKEGISKSVSELEWIYNDELKQDKRKKGEELIKLLNEGWVKGRKYSKTKTMKHSDKSRKKISDKKRGTHRVYNEDGTWHMGKTQHNLLIFT